ncbi:MAG: hypothetical protein NVS3B25_07320 [Hymenobacter sp.]
MKYLFSVAAALLLSACAAHPYATERADPAWTLPLIVQAPDSTEARLSREAATAWQQAGGR